MSEAETNTSIQSATSLSMHCRFTVQTRYSVGGGSIGWWIDGVVVSVVVIVGSCL